MICLRPSRFEDIPRQRELWALAFGDSGAYVDNFYHNYYRPERVLVLEEDGELRSMTAWFDTTCIASDKQRYKAGYLYAVATHPDDRGKGYAAQLLRYAGEYLSREQGCHLLTTVPARPSLHRFFGANGFRECFSHRQGKAERPELPVSGLVLEELSPEEYGALREELLQEIPHIHFPVDALTYQAGCCRVSGGGLYKITGGNGPAAVCAEGMEDGTLLVKELLCGRNEENELLDALWTLLPAFSGWYRTPGIGVDFGMIKGISDDLTKLYLNKDVAYMGLGFD